ncbi:hypothetical protein INR49_006278 [Caranx melampygus]|nr:hypothetical protein INR49_006278 [Caranx melampygus]
MGSQSGSVRLGSVRIGVGWSGLSALVLVRMEPQFAEQDQKICRTEATPLLCGRIQTVKLKDCCATSGYRLQNKGLGSKGGHLLDSPGDSSPRLHVVCISDDDDGLTARTEEPDHVKRTENCLLF